MNRLLAFAASILFFASTFIATGLAQDPNVGNGNQPFTAGSGEISTDSLNIHLDIPLVTTPGIDAGFQFGLHFTNNFWYPATCGESNSNGPDLCWTPNALDWGWSPDATQGFGAFIVVPTSCLDGNSVTHYEMVFLGYMDAAGNTHSIPPPPGQTLQTPWITVSGTVPPTTGGCHYPLNNQALTGVGTVIANDGSGLTYTLRFPGYGESTSNSVRSGGVPQVTTSHGTTLTPGLAYTFQIPTNWNYGATLPTNPVQWFPTNYTSGVKAETFNHNTTTLPTQLSWPSQGLTPGSPVFTNQLGVAAVTMGNLTFLGPQEPGLYGPAGPAGLCGTSATKTYTYPTSSTTTATATVNCAQFSIAFNPFLVGALSFQPNYFPSGYKVNGQGQGPVFAYLPTSVLLADGSQYVLAYESQLAGTVTGRLTSITYPNGHKVTYSYPGSNYGMWDNGFMVYGPNFNYVTFPDGTTQNLNRTDESGTWKYSRTPITGNIATGMAPPNDYFSTAIGFTTTVTDPSGNNSVYTYYYRQVVQYPANGGVGGSAFTVSLGSPLLTQTQNYQGVVSSSNLLKTAITCYNGVNVTNPIACVTTLPPSLPITEEDLFTTYPGLGNPGSAVYNRDSKTFDQYQNTLVEAIYDFGASTPTRKVVASTYGGSWNDITSSCGVAYSGVADDSPCQVTLEDSSNRTLGNSRFTYSNGKPVAVESLAGSAYLTTRTTYNSNGTVANLTDANGNVTTLSHNQCNSGLLTKSVMPTVTTSPITKTSITSNVLTVTTANAFTAGQQVLLSGTAESYLNNQTITILTASATSVTASFTHADYTNTADAGIAGLVMSNQITYDSACFGRAVSATDPNGKSTSAQYGDPFLRTTQFTDEEGNATTRIYTPTTVESVLNFQSSTIDLFKQTNVADLTTYSQQLESPTSTVWDTVVSGYSWGSSGLSTSTNLACATTKGTGCSTTSTVSTRDALGRILQVTTPAPSTGGAAGVVTNTYTASETCTSGLLGCLITTTVLSPAPQGETVKQAAKEFNGIGQLIAQCEITATGVDRVACGFGGYTGYPTIYTYNLDGTLHTIVRSSSSGTQQRTFSYDTLGRVTTATYPESGTIQFFYDTPPTNLGVTCNSILPAGTPAHFYGQLVTVFDANHNIACYAYDGLNRVTAIAYSGPNFDGNNKYFVYDAARVDNTVMPNTVNRLAEAYTAASINGTKTTDEGFGYTARGKLSDVYESTPNSSGWYHFQATYYPNGQVNSISGISGGPWTYGLDGKGRLYSVSASTTVLTSATAYNAADQPLSVTLGLGDVDAFTYDPNTGAQLSSTVTVGSNPTSISTSLIWNSNGTLRSMSRLDSFHVGGSQNCTYGTSSAAGYDDLGRLVSVSCTGPGTALATTTTTQAITAGTSSPVSVGSTANIQIGQYITVGTGTAAETGVVQTVTSTQVTISTPWTKAHVSGVTVTPYPVANLWAQNFSFDAFGNITKTVPSGTYVYTPTTWNPSYNLTNNSFTGSTADANGNLLTDTVHTYTWNQNNQVASIPDVNVSAVYDALKRRVETKTGTTYRQAILSPVGNLGLMNIQAVSQYRIPLPAGVTAASGINFWHPDWLGSNRFISSRGGRSSVEDRAFAPYGEVFASFGAGADVGFTGDAQDLIAGLSDTPNRELDSTPGRWISVDPKHSGWNGYAYTTNPLSKTDPSGLSEDDPMVGNFIGDEGFVTFYESYGYDDQGQRLNAVAEVSGDQAIQVGTIQDPCAGSCGLVYVKEEGQELSPTEKQIARILEGAQQAALIWSAGMIVLLDSVVTVLNNAFDMREGCHSDACANGGFIRDVSLSEAATVGAVVGSAASVAKGISSSEVVAGLMKSSTEGDPFFRFGGNLEFTNPTLGTPYEGNFSREMGWPSRLGQAGFGGRTAPAEWARTGYSTYREAFDQSGYWRTSDHWGTIGASNYNLGSAAEMKALGGTEVEPGFWLFDKPVTGFTKY